MKTVWVVVLSLIALVLGSCGGLAWRGASTALEGIRIACALTSTAEQSGILTKAQVADTVDRLSKSLSKQGGPDSGSLDQLTKELKSGCPTFASFGKKG
ncbi:MAG: hypothetical protein ACKVP7_24190 [Hyphomicrobiaceae bacterium]